MEWRLCKESTQNNPLLIYFEIQEKILYAHTKNRIKRNIKKNLPWKKYSKHYKLKRERMGNKNKNVFQKGEQKDKET